MEQVTDHELWRRAASGEPDAFGVLFDRHGERVRAYCARRTGSLDAADDLVSIVFLEAWRRRDGVQLIDDSALPWLYGIANHTIQRRYRTTLRHRRALARLAPAALSAPDHADDVTARLDDQRHLARLQTALRSLRPTDQEVLTLCLWQGLDYGSAPSPWECRSAPSAPDCPAPAPDSTKRSTTPTQPPPLWCTPPSDRSCHDLNPVSDAA